MSVSDLKEIRRRAGEIKREREILLSQRAALLSKQKESQETLESLQQAKEVINLVSESVRSHLEGILSSVVSSAMEAIFPDPYAFEVSFEYKRNQIETVMKFIKGGNDTSPLLGMGGGAVDVAAFALRMAFIAIRGGRPILVLDEPFKFVSVDLQNKCSDMIKELSRKLSIQVIMVSHLPEIISGADRIFLCEQVKNHSEVRQM